MLSKLGALRKFYCRYGDFIKRYEVPLSRMLHDFWRMVIYSDTIHLSDITPIVYPVTDLDFITEFDFSP